MTPPAPRAAARPATSGQTDFDVAIVGAGVHGLCTAFALRRTGALRLAVFERHEPGHAHGSSHGAARITRSSYHEPAFVALAQRAHREGWPQLEQALGERLRVPTPGVFHGPADGPFAAYLAATLGSGAPVEALDLAAARRRFPLLGFAAGDAVLLDHSAAMLLAGRTMAALPRRLAAHGTALHWQDPVLAIEPAGERVLLHTASRGWTTRAAVLAAGPWAGALWPALAPQLVVLHQHVGYFDLGVPRAAVQPGAFPVWARIGRTPNDFQYGLPDDGERGVKVAQHRTVGRSEDPAAPLAPDPAALLALAGERFPTAAPVLRHTETCRYTMTADQHFVVARAAGAPRVVLVAACSGHGFKFAPVVGADAAALALAALQAPLA